MGYIEFVQNSDVIASIHKWRGFFKGPFEEKSVYEYFKQKVYPEHFKKNLNALKVEKKERERKAKMNVKNKRKGPDITEAIERDTMVPKNSEIGIDPDDDLILEAMK